MTDLSGIVVNYNTASFARGAVRSFLAEARVLRIDGRAATSEILVVDNGSPNDDREALRAIETEGARVLLHGRNPGYGGGVNFGLRSSGGRFVAVLNPDIEFVPGALRRLFDYLVEHEDVGAVGGKNFLDREQRVILPRNHQPRLLDHVRQTLAQLSPFWCRRYSTARARAAHAYWTGREPADLDMLSGCCFLARREVLEKVGLFDEAYPLYYEDADLFRALRRAGYRCAYLPDAEILHFWSRSVSTAPRGEPMRRFYASQDHYFRKFYGGPGYLLYLACQGAIRLWPEGRRMRPMGPIADLGRIEAPPAVRFPRRVERFLAEICGDPMFLLAGGIYGSGDRFEFPPSGWEALDPARYYVRVLDLASFETVGTWSMEKVRP